MPGPTEQANISTEPTTLPGIFHRLLHRLYNAFIERDLHRFAPTRTDRMID